MFIAESVTEHIFAQIDARLIRAIYMYVCMCVRGLQCNVIWFGKDLESQAVE